MVATILERRLTELIEAGTDRTKQTVDDFTLGEVKRLARTSESALRATYDVVITRLRQPHAQIRVHALRLCDELFTRSKQFRQLLVSDLGQVLPLALGHKPETPLPPPAGAAAKLRKAALECLERWNSQYGAVYGQIRVIYNYLKDTLRLPFPDLQAQAAARAAEAEAQQAREQAAAREEYDRLNATISTAETDYETTLAQLEHCCDLLSPRPQPGNAGEEALEWEDADTEGRATEGLAMYAAAPSGVLCEPTAYDPAAASKLQELSQVAYEEQLPRLQGWLQMLVRVQLDSRADQAHREGLKHKLLELRTRLTVIQPRVELLLSSSQAAPAPANAQDSAGPSTHSTAPKAQPEAAQSQPSATQQPDLEANGPADAADAEQAPSHVMSAPEIEQEAQPTMVDVFGSSDDEDEAAGQLGIAAEAQPVPSGLKQKLLAEAPTVPHGAHLAYWDTAKARSLVNARGMELSNHWGPVDAHTELPAERLAEFFGMRASYYEAPKAPAAASIKAEPAAEAIDVVAGATAAALQPPPGSRQRKPVKLTRPQPKVTALFNPALGLPQSTPSWTGSSRLPAPQSQQPGSSSPDPDIADDKQAARLQAGGATAQQQQASAAGAASSARSSHNHLSTPEPSASHSPELTRQQQRQRDRHHNIAVLGMLPRSSAQAEQQQGKPGAKRKAPQGTTRQRLTRRLLGHRGVKTALAEVSGVEHDITREREGNRW